jgi:hypothetical protein
MQQLFDRSLFTVGEVSYTWKDVILFAMLSGRWRPLERAIREGLACVRCIEEDDIAEPEDAVDAFAAEFRYARELITAEETEAWLEARGVETSVWMAWARREALRALWAAQVPGLLQRFPADAAEVAEAATADLLCSGKGTEFSEELAERAAAAAAVEEAGEELAVELPEGAVERVLAQLPGLDPEETEATLTHLAGLEQALARFRELAASPELIHRELELGRLEWIRLDCRVMQFPTEALAREAVLCVREDGMGVDEVAESAHAQVQEMRFYLGELDPDLQTRLLAALPQELIGPAPFEEQYALFLVLDKVLPDERAPALRREIERRAVARAVAGQVSRRVHWLGS